MRPPYPSQGPAEVCCAPQRARPAAGRLAQACPHRPAPHPAASQCRIPLRAPTLSHPHTLAPAGSPGRDRRAQACGRRRGKGAPDPVRRHRPRARRLRRQVASWTPTSPPSRVGNCAPQRLESAPQPPSDGARDRSLRRPRARRPGGCAPDAAAEQKSQKTISAGYHPGDQSPLCLPLNYQNAPRPRLQTGVGDTRPRATNLAS